MIPFGFLALVASVCFALPADKPVPVSDDEGQKLAAELRSMRPQENLEVKGHLKVRDGDGKRRQIPIHYQFLAGGKTWQSIYETDSPNQVQAERLLVIHGEGQPNRYLYSRGSHGPAGEPDALAGAQAMIPFARSDFWLADLGLEFLHWPEQRIVHEAKIKMRKSRPCKVLESINPQPGAAGYTRLRSWIDAESGGVILARAYGPDNRLMKEFEVGGLTKVNGKWELKDMEMRDARTDSQTILEFKYQQRTPQ